MASWVLCIGSTMGAEDNISVCFTSRFMIITSQWSNCITGMKNWNQMSVHSTLLNLHFVCKCGCITSIIGGNNAIPSQLATSWICFCSLLCTSLLDALAPMVSIIFYFITMVDLINCNVCIQSRMNIRNENGTYGWNFILPQKMVVQIVYVGHFFRADLGTYRQWWPPTEWDVDSCNCFEPILLLIKW